MAEGEGSGLPDCRLLACESQRPNQKWGGLQPACLLGGAYLPLSLGLISGKQGKDEGSWQLPIKAWPLGPQLQRLRCGFLGRWLQVVGSVYIWPGGCLFVHTVCRGRCGCDWGWEFCFQAGGGRAPSAGPPWFLGAAAVVGEGQRLAAPVQRRRNVIPHS